MKQIIVITGASSGFGTLAARRLAHTGHTVYAGMRDTTGRNAPQVAAANKYATEHHVDLRAIEMDVASEESCDAAVRQIISEEAQIDVVVHNAGHMSFGPAEAFTPKQFAELYDINVLSTQRVNRAALPQLRKQHRGLVIWVSSSSARGGTPPYLSPYFAAKAAMDSLAVSYASELTRWGIETSIVVPGAFTKGTNHFAHAGSPSAVVTRWPSACSESRSDSETIGSSSTMRTRRCRPSICGNCARTISAITRAAAGNTKRTVVPLPGSLTISISPECRCIIP